MKRRLIIIDKDVVIREIEHLTYKLAETSVPEGGDNIAADNDETLDARVLDSLMDSRDTRVRYRLANVLENTFAPIVSNRDRSRAESEFHYHLILDDAVPDSKVVTECDILHDYFVKGVLLDWYQRIGTSFGADLAKEVEDLENSMLCGLTPDFVNRHPIPHFRSHKIR